MPSTADLLRSIEEKKPTNLPSPEETPNQEFFPMANPACQNLLNGFLADTSAPRVQITYSAGIEFKTKMPSSSPENNKQKVNFQQTRLIPKAAVERAKYDNVFNPELCHSIAFSYRDSMMDIAASNAGGDNRDQLLCYCCGTQRGTHVVQVPTESWHVTPLMISEEAGYILCDNAACDAQVKQEFMAQASQLAAFWDAAKRKATTEMVNSPPKNVDEREEDWLPLTPPESFDSSNASSSMDKDTSTEDGQGGWFLSFALFGDSKLALALSTTLLVIAIAVSLYVDGDLPFLETLSPSEIAYRELGPVPIIDPATIFQIDESQSAKSQISNEMLEAYNRDGVIAVRGILDSDDLDALDRATRTMVEEQRNGTLAHPPFIMAGYEHCRSHKTAITVMKFDHVGCRRC